VTLGEPRSKDILSVSLHPSKPLLAIATAKGNGLIDLTSGREFFLLGQHGRMVFDSGGAIWLQDGKSIDRKTVKYDSAGTPSLETSESIPLGSAVGVYAIGREGRVIASANITHATIWSRDTPDDSVSLQPLVDCRYVTLSPDGRLAVTVSHDDNRLKVWDADGGGLVRDFPSQPHTCAWFTPDGQWLMCDTGRRWNSQSWLEGITVPPGVSCCTPDGKRLAVAGIGFVRLLDFATGREFAQLSDPCRESMSSLVFSADGSLLVGLNQEGDCVRIWDLRKVREGLVKIGLDWD
jgi:WD40 repeat protein